MNLLGLFTGLWVRVTLWKLHQQNSTHHKITKRGAHVKTYGQVSRSADQSVSFRQGCWSGPLPSTSVGGVSSAALIAYITLEKAGLMHLVGFRYFLCFNRLPFGTHWALSSYPRRKLLSNRPNPINYQSACIQNPLFFPDIQPALSF